MAACLGLGLLVSCVEPGEGGPVAVTRGIYTGTLVAASDGCTEQLVHIAPAEWDIRLHEEDTSFSAWIPLYTKSPFEPRGRVQWLWTLLHPAEPYGDRRPLFSEACAGIDAHEQLTILEQSPEHFTIEITSYSSRGWCVGFDEQSCEGTRVVEFELVEECPVGCDMRRAFQSTAPDPLGERIPAMECDCGEVQR